MWHCVFKADLVSLSAVCIVRATSGPIAWPEKNGVIIRDNTGNVRSDVVSTAAQTESEDEFISYARCTWEKWKDTWCHYVACACVRYTCMTYNLLSILHYLHKFRLCPSAFVPRSLLPRWSTVKSALASCPLQSNQTKRRTRNSVWRGAWTTV